MGLSLLIVTLLALEMPLLKAHEYPKIREPSLENWDVGFDCKIKKLAYEYATKLSAGSGRKGDSELIFDAMQLGAICNETYPGRFKQSWNPSFEHEYHTLNDIHEVFVDIKNGRKSFQGTIYRPLNDIQDGINMCSLKLGQSQNNEKCIVYVREGIYMLKKPIQLASNIDLKNFKHEKVVISGNRAVTPKWNAYKTTVDRYEGFNPIFETITPKKSTKSITYYGVVAYVAACEALCKSGCTSYVYYDKTVKGFENQCYGRLDGMWNPVFVSGTASGKKINIYSADLSSDNLVKVDQIFYGGERFTRARFPNANTVLQGLHTEPTGYVPSADSWLPPMKYENAKEIHVASPTRNATLFPAFQIGIGGPVSQFEPPRSYWGTTNPYGGGGATYKVPSGLTYPKEVEMNYRGWKKPSTGFVHAFQNLHWENWIFKLDSRNEGARTLSWTKGGFQGARGSTAGGEWYVENIFEELDVANEWFYDESTKVLYFMPNLTAGQKLPDEILIPQIPSLIEVVGSQNKPKKNVTISGLTLTGTTTTFMESYMVPSGGDWTVHPNGMVYLEGTENVVVEGCTFDSPGGNGVFVFNYNRGTVISHNTMFRLGDNGIVLVGESRLIDGSVGNQPRGTQILYNIITENGIWGKQTYPFVQSVSCMTRLEGNIFFSGPRAGMNFNDGFGGGNQVISNLLFNFVRETDDHGPINTWDRVPYLTRVGDGKTLSLDVKENYIHNNFIINNYRSVWPIDHDDGTCYWRDTKNFLVYGGFKNYLGHDKISDSNIYVYPDRHVGGREFNKVYCADTQGQTIGTSGYGDVYTNNICVIGKEDIYTLGRCDPQKIPWTIPHFAHNQIFTPNATMVIKCGGETWNLEQAQLHLVDIGTKVSKLPDDDEIIQWGKNLFGL